MYVNGPGGSGLPGGERINGIRPTDGTDAPHPRGRRPGAAEGAETPLDRVEISAQARALAESDATAQSDATAESEPVGLLPQLVVRMRGRLASHFYDRPEVMAQTARNILESGDLREAG